MYKITFVTIANLFYFASKYKIARNQVEVTYNLPFFRLVLPPDNAPSGKAPVGVRPFN